jgi:hypothetical protein
MQKSDMQHLNDRYEQLAHWLKTELLKEHTREAEQLLKSKRERKGHKMKLFKERLERVDTLLIIMQHYDFTSGSEEADFLMFAMSKWRKTVMQVGDIIAALSVCNHCTIAALSMCNHCTSQSLRCQCAITA